uniref:Guanine nucleotide-binding protein G(Q) subunit alpha n=1 Tax=Parastrongyloides trichosuri TaxID=131310 RepID=A0A0N4ZQ78_PARTI
MLSWDIFNFLKSISLCSSESDAKQYEVSKEIDKELNQSKSKFTRRMLLLGPGESGKSTCLKQMQILHNKGFTTSELSERKLVIFSNTIKSILTMVNVLKSMNKSHSISNLDEMVQRLEIYLREELDSNIFHEDVANIVKYIWSQKSIQEVYKIRDTYQLIDSAEYFLSDIDRLSSPDYVPSIKDILMVRIPTTGVVQVNFRLKNIDFKVFDVGGQRSERRKWIHCFDNVHGIIFIAAISEYNQVIREDNSTNRLMEAIELFDSVSNSHFFEQASIIIFLNKKDIFAEKIKHVSIKECFPTYEGGSDYSTSMKFIGNQFLKQYRGKKHLYMHSTCATDTNQVQHVLNSVIDTILQKNLKESGMI